MLTDRDETVDFNVAEQTAVHEHSERTTQARFGTTATDPGLDGYLGELTAGVGRHIRRLLGFCRELGWIGEDAFDELVETAAVISSIETHTRMVHRDGWTLDAYRAWFLRTLDEVVVRPEPGRPGRR